LGVQRQVAQRSAAQRSAAQRSAAQRSAAQRRHRRAHVWCSSLLRSWLRLIPLLSWWAEHEHPSARKEEVAPLLPASLPGAPSQHTPPYTTAPHRAEPTIVRQHAKVQHACTLHQLRKQSAAAAWSLGSFTTAPPLCPHRRSRHRQVHLPPHPLPAPGSPSPREVGNVAFRHALPARRIRPPPSRGHIHKATVADQLRRGVGRGAEK